MKCHYTNVPELGKILIPECWTVVISQDISDCTCADNPHLRYIKKLKSEGKFEEAKEYRKVMNENKSKNQ